MTSTLTKSLPKEIPDKACPSGLRRRIQDPLLYNAWVQTPLTAFYLVFNLTAQCRYVDLDTTLLLIV